MHRTLNFIKSKILIIFFKVLKYKVFNHLCKALHNISRSKVEQFNKIYMTNLIFAVALV
jgi:hypothetical protein